MSKFLRRVGGKKGMEALQAVILLGAAFIIVIALKAAGGKIVDAGESESIKVIKVDGGGSSKGGGSGEGGGGAAPGGG